MDLQDTPIEVAIGPYEVYTDRLYGTKTAFESFVTLRNPEESAALETISVAQSNVVDQVLSMLQTLIGPGYVTASGERLPDDTWFPATNHETDGFGA